MMDHCEHLTRAHAMSEGRLARPYVAYYRVSTIQRRQFGFSIEARRVAVQDYVSANPGSVAAEFSEVMRRRKDRRPEFARALSMCRITRAVLVIARLDRLSRNVEMIARLIEVGLNLSPWTSRTPTDSRSTFSLRSPSTSHVSRQSG
jgi:hypothetical protein